MDSDSCIEQKGVIESIDNGLATVNITSAATCDHCHSKSSCDLSGQSSRKISVSLPDDTFYRGDQVTVAMKRTLGLQASLLAYMLPFLLVLASLAVMTSAGMVEWLAGVISVLILVPYFSCLYFFRGRLKRTFTLTLRKDG